MAYFIKKIFQNRIDEHTHQQFVRFSKGVFDNKAVINASRNGKIKLSGTYDLSNDLALFSVSLAGKAHVKGLILSKNEIPGFNGKKKKGLINYEIDQDIDLKNLEEISEKAYCLLIDCLADGIEFKTKKVLPRPSSKGIDKINDKFWTLNLDIRFWPKVKEDILFDLPEGKKYRVIHKYEINEIIAPKGEKDFEKIRLMAKRKGVIIRTAEIDGKPVSNKKEMIV